MKDIKLNEIELGMVQGGNNLVIEMDPAVAEQVIRNAQPLAPRPVSHNPYFKLRLDCPYVKEYKMKDGRVIRGYIQAGLFVEVK